MYDNKHNTHWIFNLNHGSSTTNYAISYIVLTLIGVIYFSTMSVLTILALYCKNNEVHIRIRITSTIHTISFLLSYLLIGIMFFIPHIVIINGYIIFYIIDSILFTFGHLSFYIFLLLQVYYAFVDKNLHGSIYTISMKLMYGHCILFIIDIILFICIWYFWYTTYYTTKYTLILVILCTAAGILLLFTIFHFIYTFNSKLLLLTINLSTNPTSNRRNIQLQNIDSSLNDRQKKLINAMTKQSVLWCYSLFIILLLIIIGLMLYIFHKRLNWIKKTETISLIVRWFLLTERITEEISIYLSFIMNDKLYFTLCNKCHYSLENQCHKLAERKLLSQQQNKNINNMNTNMNKSVELHIKHRTKKPDIPPANPNLKDNIRSDSSIELEQQEQKNENRNENDESFVTDDEEKDNDFLGQLPNINTNGNINCNNNKIDTITPSIGEGEINHGGQISNVSNTFTSTGTTITSNETSPTTNTITSPTTTQSITNQSAV